MQNAKCFHSTEHSAFFIAVTCLADAVACKAEARIPAYDIGKLTGRKGIPQTDAELQNQGCILGVQLAVTTDIRRGGIKVLGVFENTNGILQNQRCVLGIDLTVAVGVTQSNGFALIAADCADPIDGGVFGPAFH